MTNQIHSGDGDNVSGNKIINYIKGLPNWLIISFFSVTILLLSFIAFQDSFNDLQKQLDTNNMVLIEGGTSIIGQSGEISDNPAHNVILSPYWIDKSEVTVKDYVEFCKKNGFKLPQNPDFKNMENYFTDSRWENYPVVNVTWYEAKKYCECQNKRLPTEAEWENAAKNKELVSVNQFNPEEANYPDSSILIYFTNYHPINLNNDNYPYTSPVGMFTMNHNHIYDLNGNVSEWCFDSYERSFYLDSKELNPVNLDSTNNYAVVRGPSWLNWNSSVSKRNRKNKLHGYWDVGFRCAATKKQID